MTSLSEAILRSSFARQYFADPSDTDPSDTDPSDTDPSDTYPEYWIMPEFASVSEVSRSLSIPTYEIEHLIREGLIEPDDPSYLSQDDLKGLLCYMTGQPSLFYFTRH